MVGIILVLYILVQEIFMFWDCIWDINYSNSPSVLHFRIHSSTKSFVISNQIVILFTMTHGATTRSASSLKLI